jgi:outer membrane PBP1 activator LpoA protein
MAAFADGLAVEVAELMEGIMSGNWAKVILLLAMMCGLCATAQPITTAAAQAASTPFDNGTVPVRVALLLPLRSALFGAAADAVRSGFLTAAERQRGNLIVTVIETADAAPDVLATYRDVASKYDIIVGPLSRSAVTALAQSGSVARPTIALVQPDLPDNTAQRVPPLMLMMGLSIEDEARQIAAWTEREKAPGKIFAVATNVAWQRRAIKAFSQEARHIGLTVEELDVSVSSNVLSASGLAQLSQRIQAEKPALLFVALDAGQTAQLRSAIGNDVPLYGTSQLNPLTWANATRPRPAPAADASVAAAPNALAPTGVAGGSGSAVADPRRPELDGVRLVDLPWQLPGAPTGASAYARPAVAGGSGSADLERLYALGIDAFRVADELAQQRTSFDLDGVTGQLSVNMTPAVTYVQRREMQAVYQDGIVVPLSDQR